VRVVTPVVVTLPDGGRHRTRCVHDVPQAVGAALVRQGDAQEIVEERWSCLDCHRVVDSLDHFAQTGHCWLLVSRYTRRADGELELCHTDDVRFAAGKGRSATRGLDRLRSLQQRRWDTP